MFHLCFLLHGVIFLILFHIKLTTKLKRIFEPGSLNPSDFHQLLIGSVAPRPIAFVSTQKDGVLNLAPYSFFNLMSTNPPILVFSTSLKGKDKIEKDTLHNILETNELVVNVVSYDMMRQMSIASAEFDPNVSEFDKAGFTPVKSKYVNPPRVEESPVNMECRLNKIIDLGSNPSTGKMIICDVLCVHINESILDGYRINQEAIDLVGRLGRTYYSRTNASSLLSIKRPLQGLPIGFDGLPDYIVKSNFLTGNEIARMADLPHLPELLEEFSQTSQYNEDRLSIQVKKFLAEEKVAEAYSLMHYYHQEKTK